MFPFSITSSFKTTFPLLDEVTEHLTVPNAAGSVRASPLEEQELGPWREGSLHSLVDFNVNSAIIGDAGSGTSVGMLFALNAHLAEGIGRPLLVVHGPGTGQPHNWTGLPVWTLSTHNKHQGDLAAKLLKWLEPRAHQRPILVVEEAYELLGKRAEQFLADLPEGVTVVWQAQTVKDLGLPVLSSCFQVAHLMSMPLGKRDGKALGLGAEHMAQLGRRFASRTVGRAVSIPLGSNR